MTMEICVVLCLVSLPCAFVVESKDYYRAIKETYLECVKESELDTSIPSLKYPIEQPHLNKGQLGG